MIVLSEQLGSSDPLRVVHLASEPKSGANQVLEQLLDGQRFMSDVFVVVFEVFGVGGVVDFGQAEKTRRKVTNAWPTTTFTGTAPEQKLEATRKTPAGNRQSGCRSPSVLPAQSLQKHSCRSAEIFA